MGEVLCCVDSKKGFKDEGKWAETQYIMEGKESKQEEQSIVEPSAFRGLKIDDWVRLLHGRESVKK